MSGYIPPFTITPCHLTLTARIAELIGRYSVFNELNADLKLRRINRIRTIQGSLAIEGNTLSLDQITAVLDGKTVIAPPVELLEVRNAIKVYDIFSELNLFHEPDMLKAYTILMAGLIDAPGNYRSGGVGVMSGTKVVHLAPPASRVSILMIDLFEWIQMSDIHPLIKGTVFHYEFEFIHPFEDGNGRMGRLWQSLLLNEWNPLFANLPVESLVFKHQQEYYHALNVSSQNADSAPFIHFMLQIIHDALLENNTPEVSHEVTPEVKRFISAINGEMSKHDIMLALELKDEKNFRERYLKPVINAGLCEMTRPDAPNSRLQKYRLTEIGRQLK